MTLTLTHVIAEQSPAEAAMLLSELLAWPDHRRRRQRVLVWGAPPAGLRIPDNVPYERLPRRFAWPAAAQRHFRSGHAPAMGVEIVHAWGAAASSLAGYAFRMHPQAGFAPATTGVASATSGVAPAVRPRGSRWASRRCSSARQGRRNRFSGCTLNATTPLLTTLVDPAEVRHWCRWWRDLAVDPDGGNILCTSSVLADRLASAGVPEHAVTVLPPVIDAARDRPSGAAVRREDLGLPADARVLLTAGPPSRAGGQFFAVWTTAALRKIRPNLHLLIPGCSGEQRRLQRFVATMYCPEAFRLCGDRYAFGQLLDLADLLVFPAVEDVPVGGLVRAMAAGVPVVAGDVPTVREWITDGRTGFLCRPADTHDLAVRVREALEDDSLRRRCAAEGRAAIMAADVGRKWLDRYSTLLDAMSALAARWHLQASNAKGERSLWVP